MIKKSILSLAATFCCLVLMNAQQTIAVMNSSTKQVLQLSDLDGSVVNLSYIDTSPQSPGTIKGIAQIDDKIWITDQTQDRIYIYSNSGSYESTITGSLDNIRGLNVVNNEVWVANEGSNNGATANSVVRFSKAGALLGSYPTILSPFDAFDIGGGSALVSSFSSNGIAKLSYDGTVSTPFVPAAVLSNPEQMNFNTTGNIIVAVFGSLGSNPAGIYEYTPSGTMVNKWPISTGSVRGVIAAQNGNYLVSTSTGVYSLNPTTSVSTLIVAGNFQFFTKLSTNLAVNENAGISAKIYPNPVKDVLNISNNKDIDQVMIYSATGQLQMQQKVKGNSAQLDLSKLSSGMYLLKIQDKSLKTQTLKVIKK
jgi:hypothetical protein